MRFLAPAVAPPCGVFGMTMSVWVGTTVSGLSFHPLLKLSFRVKRSEMRNLINLERYLIFRPNGAVQAPIGAEYQ